MAIIGGTGVCNPKLLEQIMDNVEEGDLDTFYGPIHFTIGEYGGKEVVFLPRHGKFHSIAPSVVNYRANILGLKRLGVSAIISTTAVGSLSMGDKPGDFVLPDQFIDFTKNRESSFFGNGDNGVVHIDMTEPYCPTLRRIIMESSRDIDDLTIHDRGTYVCAEGPRFETPAEIKMFSLLGGDIVGMTNVPEVCLAREAEICYATISIVTNYGAGLSATNLSHAEVVDMMSKNAAKLRDLVLKSIERYDGADCLCQHSLDEYGGFSI